MRGARVLVIAIAVASLAAGVTEAAKPGPAGNTESNIFVQNTLVRSSVEDSDGTFGIGTSSNHPTRPCESLLYGYSCGSNSSTTNIIVRVDSTNWVIIGGSCDDDATHVSTAVSGGSIVSTYSIPSPAMTVVVRHTPVSFDADTAAILVRTTVTNNSGASHSVGILYEYDTEVADNDAAQVAAGGNFVDVETCFDNPAFTYWEAAENGFPPAATDLIGRGTLVGADAVVPNFIGIGYWGSMDDACWDYTCSGAPYGDSAVLMRWNQVTVAAGANRTVGTYYGVGAVDTSAGDLSISLSAPSALTCTPNGLSPNPFGLTSFVTNTTVNRCLDVVATLSLGAGLTTANPLVVNLGAVEPAATEQGFWNITATGSPCDTDLTYSVEVTSSNCATNSNGGTVTVPCCSGQPTPTPSATPIPSSGIPTLSSTGVLVFVLLLAGLGAVLVAFRRTS